MQGKKRYVMCIGKETETPTFVLDIVIDSAINIEKL